MLGPFPNPTPHSLHGLLDYFKHSMLGSHSDFVQRIMYYHWHGCLTLSGQWSGDTPTVMQEARHKVWLVELGLYRL